MFRRHEPARGCASVWSFPRQRSEDVGVLGSAWIPADGAGEAAEAGWLPHLDFATAHLEVRSETGEPLPISETGYRSHFLPREAVEEYGGPVEFVKAWLDHDAAKPAWKKYVQERRQLSLF